MMNFERMGAMDSSWIWGRATMSTMYLPGRRIIRFCFARSSFHRPMAVGGRCWFAEAR
jgi:hypothetical protein